MALADGDDFFRDDDNDVSPTIRVPSSIGSTAATSVPGPSGISSVPGSSGIASLPGPSGIDSVPGPKISKRGGRPKKLKRIVGAPKLGEGGVRGRGRGRGRGAASHGGQGAARVTSTVSPTCLLPRQTRGMTTRKNQENVAGSPDGLPTTSHGTFIIYFNSFFRVRLKKINF